MREAIKEMLASLGPNSENEVVELKEAKTSFATKDLGQYFSALSNEANLKGKSSAFIIFGVRDDGKPCGTTYRQEASKPSKGLSRLKKEIAEGTNNRITFREIEEVEWKGKRLVVFEVPPATRGIPTQWAGAAWAREGSSLVPLPLSKVDEIRAQPPHDWSRQVVEDATIDDLDPEALLKAKEKFRERYGDREGLIDGLDDIELLDKAGITYRGSITNTALLLLGRSEAAKALVGTLPKMTWTLYEQDGSVRAYQHFDPPFLLSIDELGSKIRNEERQVLADPESLLPIMVTEYDSWSIRELIGNAIAHQAYEEGGKVNVEEFADRLVFLNEGGFIPGSLEAALQPGYKPPYYRNPFLVDAMFSVGMLDQNAMGIRTVCKNARDRYMPLPTYRLDDPTRVQVELPNHEINSAYTRILRTMPDLPIQTVLALDKVQKHLSLSDEELEDVVERGLVVEGEAGPDFAVSREAVSDDNAKPESDGLHQVASAASVRWNGRGVYRRRLRVEEREALRGVIVDVLVEDGPLSRAEVTARLHAAIAAQGYADADRIDGSTVYRLIKELEQQGRIKGEGETRGKVWRVA